MKSLAMLNFKNISPNADFYSKLDILNKNILYVTHMEDKILKILKTLITDKDVEDQTNEFYDQYEREHDPPGPPSTQGLAPEDKRDLD